MLIYKPQTMRRIASNPRSRADDRHGRLDTARWHGAKSDQVTCDVRHVAVVLEWAVESYSGIDVLVQEQRAELVADVHKAACDLADDQLHWH
jgi:hypothetical protein